MIDRALGFVRFDASPRHALPAVWRLAAATVVALLGSLVADALIVRAAEAIFPSTKGYPHFAFGDWGKLTIIGVVIACAAWPVVVRLCAAPRWLFVRLAVLVTAVLLLPDLAIFVQGQPGRAVAGLVVMHLAIGLITYEALVRLAPPAADHVS